MILDIAKSIFLYRESKFIQAAPLVELKKQGFFEVGDTTFFNDEEEPLSRKFNGGTSTCECNACKKKLYYAELGENFYGGRKLTKRKI